MIMVDFAFFSKYFIIPFLSTNISKKHPTLGLYTLSSQALLSPYHPSYHASLLPPNQLITVCPSPLPPSLSPFFLFILLYWNQALSYLCLGVMSLCANQRQTFSGPKPNVRTEDSCRFLRTLWTEKGRQGLDFQSGRESQIRSGWSRFQPQVLSAAMMKDQGGKSRGLEINISPSTQPRRAR